jgi:hypothetical protein
VAKEVTGDESEIDPSNTGNGGGFTGWLRSQSPEPPPFMQIP